MEKIIPFEVKEIGDYNGHKIYFSNMVPKEWIATIDRAGNIIINPEAYEILKDKPDYLKKIYEHEINAGENHDPHECKDKDVLLYLKENGYDFGDFKFE